MHWNRRHRRDRPPHPDILTPAEWRVVELIREGMPNAEIAVRLGITVRTVKSHVSSILAKTGLPDRYALAEWDGVPSTATQQDGRRGARGLLLPLTGWLSSGVARVMAGSLGAVVLVGAVVVVFSQLAVGGGNDDLLRHADGTLASSGVVAIVDGLEVTEEQWQVALIEADMYADQLRALAEEAQGTASSDVIEAADRLLDKLEAEPPEVLALANLLVLRSAAAEAFNRGLGPSDDQVNEQLTLQRDFHEQIESGAPWIEPEMAQTILTSRERIIEHVGEQRYWDEFARAQARLQTARLSLLHSEGVSAAEFGAYGGQYNLELARNADIRLGAELQGKVSLTAVITYLEDFIALAKELEEAQAGG